MVIEEGEMSRDSKKVEAGGGSQLKVGQVSQFDGAGVGLMTADAGQFVELVHELSGHIINYCMKSRDRSFF